MNAILTQAQGDTLMSQGNEDARGQAINQGILGAAEGILTAPDLMSALGKGFGGYNRAFNASLVANRPKVTPLADGAFSQVTMPDGSTKIVGNQQVADFIMNKQQLGLAGKEYLARLQSGLNVDKDAFIKLRQNLVTEAGGEEASPTFNPQVTSDLTKLDSLFKWYSSADADTIAGLNSPPLSDLYNRTIGRFTNSNEFKMLRDFDQYTGENLLARAASMKGALSDKDVEFLKGMNVKTTDPTARKIEYLQEYAKRVKAGEERRMRAAQRLRELTPTGTPGASTRPATSPSAPAAAPAQIPGLSPRASQYFIE